jgi:hypothetical protein
MPTGRLSIKYKTLILWASIIVLLINCRWGEFCPAIPSVGNVYDIFLIVALFMVCKFCAPIKDKISGVTHFVDRFLLMMFLLWGIELVITIYRGYNTPSAAFSDFCQWHLKILFVYPLIYLMKEYGSKKIIRTIVVVQIIFIIIQAIVGIFYDWTRVKLISNMFKSETWIRNGLIRLSSSPLACFACLYFFNEFLHGKKTKKYFSLGMTITLFLFMYFINGGRSQYFAASFAIVAMYMVKRRNFAKQIGAMCLILIAAYYLMNSSFMAKIIGGLSTDLFDSNGTIYYRIEYLNKLLQLYGGISLWGIGYVGTSVSFGVKTFNFIDYGLLGDVLQFGVVGLIYYLGVTLRGFYVVKNASVDYHKMFCKGLSFYFIASAVGFTSLSAKRVILIPVVLAYYEFVNYVGKNNSEI